MIYNELIYAFKNDYMIECMKRGIPDEKQIKFNDKQLKIIFTKIASDLQKDFKVLESSKTVVSAIGEATYALDRSFMTLISAYYNETKLMEKSADWITKQSAASGNPAYFAIKWTNAYPYILLYPMPNEAGKNIIIKSYNDIQIYSYNDGMDSLAYSSDTDYTKIPTMYDQAFLLGMISSIFDDREPFYRKEKIRLIGLKHSGTKRQYNMTGVPSDEANSYNSDADATPSSLPSPPVYI